MDTSHFARRLGLFAVLLFCSAAQAQLIDQTKAPNPLHEGIAKSLADETGAGRGDWTTPNSSSFNINRDPFRAIRRGRQLFQRKFQHMDGGSGFYLRDGSGDVAANNAIGAGLTDSCASCHGRPRGSAGFGGNVATRPDSRDAPHLFGLGLKEMLADEITTDLRSLRDSAALEARSSGKPVRKLLASKGIDYGAIIANPDGSFDTSGVSGVDPDLRVRPLFAHGGATSIREFILGAMNNEMGMQCVDQEMWNASHMRGKYTTPAGMVLDGSLDAVDSPPDADAYNLPGDASPRNQIPTALVDYLEFYLLNYFKPGHYEQTSQTDNGRTLFTQTGCASCHMQDFRLNSDRRVADVETAYDPSKGVFNSLFASVTPLFHTTDDGSGLPALKQANQKGFDVHDIFTDFKRHDLGPTFYERNYDGTVTKLFMTTALWGVGSTAPYGHDGRSANLNEVILRHGGEAQQARDNFAALGPQQRQDLFAFLNSLILFPPDDTASSLDPGDPSADGFPQFKHGSIKLTTLFNDPTDLE